MTRPDRLVVVVGTGTEVGKTWVAARLLEQWRKAGVTVAARKPAQSFDPNETSPSDAEVLARASGEQPDTVCPAHRSYPLAVAPPMAARRLGRGELGLADLLAELHWPSDAVDIGLVETAGGLRSPQAEDADAIDLASALRPDHVLLVADAGLGTINAVRLSVDALRRAGLPTVVVLNRYDGDDRLHGDNLDWLSARDGVDVETADSAGLGRLAARLGGYEAGDQTPALLSTTVAPTLDSPEKS
jgi:dethiobiotin synthetase